MRRKYRRRCDCADQQRRGGCGYDVVTAGMSACRVRRFVVALRVMIMRGAVLSRIGMRGVLMLLMPVSVGCMSVSAGDHRRKCRHALQRQGNQQYRNQQCA